MELGSTKSSIWKCSKAAFKTQFHFFPGLFTAQKILARRMRLFWRVGPASLRTRLLHCHAQCTVLTVICASNNARFFQRCSYAYAPMHTYIRIKPSKILSFMLQGMYSETSKCLLFCFAPWLTLRTLPSRQMAAAIDKVLSGQNEASCVSRLLSPLQVPSSCLPAARSIFGNHITSYKMTLGLFYAVLFTEYIYRHQIATWGPWP